MGFIILVFLQDDNMRTLMAGLALFKGKWDINVPVMMAGSLVAIVPMLIFYLLAQRYFVRELIAGSTKE